MGGGFSAGANNLSLLDETKSCVLLGCWARMTKLTWANMGYLGDLHNKETVHLQSSTPSGS